MQRFPRRVLLLAGLVLIAGLGVASGIWAVKHASDRQSSDNSQKTSEPRNPTDAGDLELIDLKLSAESLEAIPEDELLVNTQGIANSLMHGDLLLRSGNAAMALRLYRQESDGTTVPETIDVSYRIALCAETLGDDAEALAGYQSVAEMDANGQLREYALLGQARVLHRQGHIAEASGVLQRWVLSRETTHRLSPHITGDALYLLSRMTAAEVLEQTTTRLWEPDAVCPPRSSFDPGRYLSRTPSGEEVTRSEQPVGIRIVHQLAESTPDTVTLSGHLARTTIVRVIGDLSQQTGWPVESSPLAQDMLRTATVSVDFEEQTANLILDWLLAPHGIVWDFHDGTLSIVMDQELAADDRDTFRWQRAERVLLAALFGEPEHLDAPIAYLLLGNLSFQRGQFQTARRHYEHILQAFPRISLQAEAWFNLAKVELAERNLIQATQALQGAMDAGRGQPLESAALLLAGQTALELDQPHDATRPLMRAVTLATDDDVRGLSLLSLASAHLLNGHPERANVALMEDRRILQAEPYRDRAAFLASLARFRAASTPARRDRDGRALITSMSHLPTDRNLGLSHLLLTAEAYTEVGLQHLATSLIESNFSGSPPSGIRERLVFLLIDTLIQDREDERAEALLAGIINDSSPGESVEARLRLAELYFRQSRLGLVETSCRSLLSEDVSPEVRVRALQLLGRVYSDRGDRERAVLCYSGVLPQ
ncbi:MAG: tetratricopeptide repeat protein [Planctomycetaceae bacterium]